MKTKHFYSFLVETTNITLELGDFKLTKEERVHLISLVDANIHSSVIKLILENLESEDKKVFLKNLATNDHDKTWKHLNANIQNLEQEVKIAIEETIRELKKDIKSAKSQSH